MEQKDETVPPFKLPPLGRWYFTLDKEVFLGKEILTEEKRFERLIQRTNTAEATRNALVRNFILLDALIAILLFGKTISVPGLNVSVADIPAAREIATALSSLLFQFGALAIINASAYGAIIETINRSRDQAIDPDIINASDRSLEFPLKIFREKMNIYGFDFLIPSKSYVAFSRVLIWLVMGSLMAAVALHLGIVLTSCKATYEIGGNLFLTYLFFVFVLATNLAGLMLFLSNFISFSFSSPKT